VKIRSALTLVACGTLFGLTYVLVRFTVPVVGPIPVTWIRTLIGGGVLLAVGAAAGRAPRARDWRGYAVLGALSSAVPFSLISVSMLSLDAGSAAVLNASSPMFALAIDAVVRRRRPTPTQLVGIVVSSIGVVAVIGGRSVHPVRADAVGILAGLGGAAVFAYAAFYAAGRFPDAPPLSVAAGQQLGACLLLTPVLAIVPGPARVDVRVALSVLALGLLGSAAAYLLFYSLIALEGPARAANVNLLVPVTGVLWGRVILGEAVPPVSVVGMVVTVGGLALILRRPVPA
jgi:drug/metabolite transporter (DMT)-like permease